MSDDEKTYSLQPDDDSKTGDPAPIDEPARPEVDPIDLEDKPSTPSSSDPAPDDTPARRSTRSVHDLDICPNCGANMPDVKSLVCLRCGFDLKKLKVIKTVTGEEEVEADTPRREPETLCRATAGDPWIPAGVAGGAILVLLIAYLSGSLGLFPGVEANAEGVVELTGGDRFTGLLRGLVLLATWCACGVLAISVLARMLEVRLGDPVLMVLRVVAVASVARLCTTFNLQSRSVEWTLEGLGQIAVAFALTLVFFRLTPRNAITGVGAALVSFLILWIAAVGVTWATGS